MGVGAYTRDGYLLEKVQYHRTGFNRECLIIANCEFFFSVRKYYSR